jgi:carbon monoxide dehydrogenase subunit G
MFGRRKAVEGETRIVEMREGRSSVFIESTPQKVWDCISDVKNYGQWVVWYVPKLAPHLEKLEKPGDYFDFETKLILGIKLTGRSVVVDRSPPQRTSFCFIGPYRGGGEFVLQPVANGTRVDYTVWGELPSSYLGKIVDKILLANSIQDHMHEHLERLKKHVENIEQRAVAGTGKAA